MPSLLQYIDIDQIPDFLGGENEGTFAEERGPWQYYDLVEGTEDPTGVVGVRRKEDPLGRVFTP